MDWKIIFILSAFRQCRCRHEINGKEGKSWFL